MAKCMDLHSAGAIMQDVKNSVLNQGKILSNGKELKDYQDTMNKILFIENGMIEKDNSCSCHHHHHHDHGGGSSIVSILKTDTKGLIDTYTITYSDGRTSQFYIKNGAEGPEGPAGPAGPIGLRGKSGRSAFEEAVAQGFAGTVDEWLASIRGESVYEIAVRNGFEGTEQDFVDKLFEKVVTANKDEEHYVVVDPDEAPYVKYTPQVLTKEEQAQARENINAFDADRAIFWEGVDIAEKLVDDWGMIVRYTPQFMSDALKAQARTNIGVASEQRVRNIEKTIALLDPGAVINIGDVETLLQNIKDDIYNRSQELLVVNAINSVDRLALQNEANIGNMDDLFDTDAMAAMADVPVADITTLVEAINKIANLCYETLNIDFDNDITW